MWQNALATAGWVLAALLLARLKRSQPLTRIGVSAKLPFAHAVVAGDVVYLSGVTAQADGDPIRESDSVEQQTRRVLRVIDERLSRAGTDNSRVVQAQVWLKDIGRDFAGMNAAWNEWVAPGAKPVRATVEARLATPAMLVEIQVTAAL